MAEEQSLWKGSPSQAVNFGTHLLCLLLFWLVLPLLGGRLLRPACSTDLGE